MSRRSRRGAMSHGVEMNATTAGGLHSTLATGRRSAPAGSGRDWRWCSCGGSSLGVVRYHSRITNPVAAVLEPIGTRRELLRSHGIHESSTPSPSIGVAALRTCEVPAHEAARPPEPVVSTRTKGTPMEPIHYFAATLVTRRHDDRELLRLSELHHARIHERRMARRAHRRRILTWLSSTASGLAHPDSTGRERRSESRLDLDHRGA